MNRYLKYQEAEEQALLVAARALASDRELSQALQSEDAVQVGRCWKRLKRTLDTTMPVDLVAIYDRYLNPHADDARLPVLRASSRIFSTASQGETIHELAVLADHNAYLMAAVPILNEEARIGFLVLGRKLERPFLTYSADSDKKKNKQHQLALLTGSEVFAATLPGEEREDLGAAIAQKREVAEGKFMATVMDLRDRTFDLHLRDTGIRTFDGKKSGASIALFRVRQSYEKRVTQNLYPVVYVGLGGLLAAIVIAFLLAGTITRPIQTFTNSLRDIVTGEADLSHRLEVRGSDELAGLAQAINLLTEKVNSLVVQIRDSSLRLGQSAQEISHVSLRTLEGAQGQVAKIENSTSLTNELRRTIQEISGRANQGAQIAGLGKDSVEKTDSGMARIKEAAHQSWEKVSQLKGNVEQIGSIAELISKITEENSMLALNASIEAARAGAAGQGFAVVAQQMREQAKRVEKSSREIIENIGSIQRITQELVSSMDESKTDVEKGSQLVNVTLHHLSELSTIMQETAESVKEQAAASDDIAQITLDLQRIGHEALEASQQTVDEGARIRDGARDMATLVGRFKVKELPPAGLTGTPSLPRPGEPGLPGDDEGA